MAIGLGRKTRLGIPKVQANPRPPNERRAAVAKRVVAAKPIRPSVGPARSTAAPAPTAPPATTQAATATPTPANQPVTATPTPPAPTGLFSPPSFTPQAGQVDPRDATYWTNLNKLIFNGTQEYGKNLQEQTMADTAYQTASQEALRNRAVQQRTLGENAIRSNLSASGWLNRNETEQTTDYTNQRSSASLTKSQEDQARLTARQALAEGFNLDAAAELAAAGGRQAERAEREAEQAEAERAPEAAAASSSSPSQAVVGEWWPGQKNKKPKIAVGQGKKAR